MYFSTVTALAILGATASAAPTSSPVFPPRSTGQSFTLVANVTSNDLTPSINDYVLSSYHVGAGQAFATLVPNDSSTAARVFYANGTAEDIAYRRSNILTDGGSPPFPSGVVINEDESVSINAGQGSAGVNLALFPDPISELSAVGKSGFYACEKALPSGPAVQLFTRAYEETTPAGCADVTLLAQCSESDGVEHPFVNTIGCYADVPSIDWTIYSA